jgi:hypothetical protein
MLTVVARKWVETPRQTRKTSRERRRQGETPETLIALFFDPTVRFGEGLLCFESYRMYRRVKIQMSVQTSNNSRAISESGIGG